MNLHEKIILIDNGSLEPASTRQLRRLAAELEARIGFEVIPASVAHSTRVPASALDGRPAELFEAALDRVLRAGATEVCVLPLFVGPSYAIVRHVPAVLAERQRLFPQVRMALAEPLFVPGEPRLAQILAAHVRDLLAPALPPAAQTLSRSEHTSGSADVMGREGRRRGAERQIAESPATHASEVQGAATGGISPMAQTLLRSEHTSGMADVMESRRRGRMGVRVAVVDHGSPSRNVTEVRDAVAAQVRELLGDEVAAVAGCSMERRDGPEYAFNEPLLDTLLRTDGWRDEPVIVALLFIAPGRHAGPDGDVAQIVKRARADGGAGVRFTPVIGVHPALVDVLADRVRSVRS